MRRSSAPHVVSYPKIHDSCIIARLSVSRRDNLVSFRPEHWFLNAITGSGIWDNSAVDFVLRNTLPWGFAQYAFKAGIVDSARGWSGR
jgi:hypothetical protein